MSNQITRHTRRLLMALVIMLTVVFAVGLATTMPSQASEGSTASPNANENLATALSSSDEARSLYWAASARLLQNEGDPFTALALALEANRIPNPPDQAVRALEDIAYAPGPRKILAKSLMSENAYWKANYSPDGKMIAAANEYEQGIFHLLDAGSGREIRQFKGHQYTIASVTFSPDGSKILSQSIDGCSVCDYEGDGREMILWDVNSGKQIWKLNDQTTVGDFYDPTFSPDGSAILTIDSTVNQLIEWAVKDGTVIRHFSPVSKLESDYFRVAAFSRDGSEIVSATAKGEVIVWDVATAQEQMHFSNLFQYVDYVVFMPDGKSFLISGDGGRIMTVNIASGEYTNQIWLDNSVTHIAFNADGKTFFASTSSGKIYLWNIDKQVEMRSFQAQGNILAFSPDRDTFVAGGSDIVLWDSGPGQEIRRFTGHHGIIDSVAFSPDGKTIASASNGQEVILWDVHTGEEIQTQTDVSTLKNNSELSPDGRLVIIRADQDLSVGDSVTQHIIRHLGLYGSVAIFSPDGKMILTSDPYIYSDNGYLLAGGQDVVLLRLDSPDELIKWTLANRAVGTLDCEQRAYYGVMPLCSADEVNTGTPPATLTFITSTPSPTLSPTPTTNLTQTTATITRTATQPLPSWTPTANQATLAVQVSATAEAINTQQAIKDMTATVVALTPTPTFNPGSDAIVGSQRDQLEPPKWKVWRYHGTAGEVVTIRVKADKASDNPNAEVLLYPYFVLHGPNGALLETVNGIEAGHEDESVLQNYVLPATGIYEIEVRSRGFASGSFTLVIESLGITILAPTARSSPPVPTRSLTATFDVGTLTAEAATDATSMALVDQRVKQTVTALCICLGESAAITLTPSPTPTR